jgi:ketosteroid isomerase-like protein
MRWRVTLSAVIVASCTLSASSSQTRRAESDQQTLTRLEQEWDKAFLSNDVAFVENVLAEEFIATYDDGSRGDKARELKLVAEFNQRIDSSKLDDITIKIYGDTAVVWFTRHLAGPSKGKRLEIKHRYLDVFVWRANRWQCVASQSTKITNPS